MLHPSQARGQTVAQLCTVDSSVRCSHIMHHAPPFRNVRRRLKLEITLVVAGRCRILSDPFIGGDGARCSGRGNAGSYAMAAPSDASSFHVWRVQYRFCRRARCRRLALDLAHCRSPKVGCPRGGAAALGVLSRSFRDPRYLSSVSAVQFSWALKS
jgi:hypothetical protein